jgi:hypothetical protein
MQITLFVMTEILREKTTKDRAALMAHFVRIAHVCVLSVIVDESGRQVVGSLTSATPIEPGFCPQACYKVGDFDALKAIIAALQSAAIFRLRQSWDVCGCQWSACVSLCKPTQRHALCSPFRSWWRSGSERRSSR